MKGFSIFLAIVVFLVSSANADDKKEKERLEMPEKLSLRLWTSLITFPRDFWTRPGVLSCCRPWSKAPSSWAPITAAA